LYQENKIAQKSSRKGRKLNHVFLLECEMKISKTNKKWKRGSCNFFYFWIRKEERSVEKKSIKEKDTERIMNSVVSHGYHFLVVPVRFTYSFQFTKSVNSNKRKEKKVS